MSFDNLFELGYIIKPHGTQGDVQVFLDTDQPEWYKGMESVYLAIASQPVPFFIENMQLRGQKAIVTFSGINTPEQAADLKATKMFLPLEMLPPLKKGQFYYHEVVGYEVVDKHHGMIGTVASFVDKPPQDLMVVHHQKGEVIVPVADGILLSVDHEKKQIVTNLPEGLLDVYLS